MSEAEVRVPKGGVLLFREAYHPGLSQYIRYILPENRRRGSRRSPAERVRREEDERPSPE